MQYEMMFPEQIRCAIKESWPIVLPIGVLEYHSEHCVLGVDTLVIIKAMELLQKEINIVVLPPFYYGSVSYAVAPPEMNGSIHIDSSVVHSIAREMFQALLRVGFRNIHGFVHHQSENFTAGMPTDLAFKFAARQAIFSFLEKERGEGWWGKEGMQNYYKQHDEGSDPFSWIQIHPFMNQVSMCNFPADHAGKQETSLMMALCPEGVDMKRHNKEHWYAHSAKDAAKEYGDRAKAEILNGLRKILSKK